MGRELKRVPLDFKWPMKMVWKGYVNPYRSVQCKACEGSGYSEKAMEYKNNWYGFERNNWTLNPYRRGCIYHPEAHKYNLTQLEVDALAKGGRISELCKDGYHPTPEDVREFELRDFMGLDHTSMHICLCATAEAEGWDTDCPFCGGTGEYWFSEEIRELHENWQREDPPTGEGFQLWSNTGEGCPVSPVFASMEELAKWCVDGATIFADDRLTCEQWMEMFRKECFAYEMQPGLIMM